MLAGKGVVTMAGGSGGDGLETVLKRNVPTAAMRVHTRRPQARPAAGAASGAGSSMLHL